MHKILYNPLSNKGKCKKSLKKIEKILARKKITYDVLSLLEIEGKENEYISTLSKEDILVIVGGDGTIHQIINRIRGLELTNRIFMYRAGRGNDFSRGHKGKYFEITDEIKSLPRVKAEGLDRVFLNGVGMGIDAEVCLVQAENARLGKKESYFKVALRVFKNYKQYKLRMVIDDKQINYDDVWFFVVQNGKYFGGGMMVAPKAVRDDEWLDVVIIHRVKLRKLLLIFPLIFFGKHTWFKHVGIEFLRGKKITADTIGCSTMQYDGEVLDGISHIEVER